MFGDLHKFSYYGQQQLCNDHQQLAALQPPSSPHWNYYQLQSLKTGKLNRKIFKADFRVTKISLPDY
jgi:hypothetical protein